MRWLERLQTLEKTTKVEATELTKLTEAPFVSSVSSGFQEYPDIAHRPGDGWENIAGQQVTSLGASSAAEDGTEQAAKEFRPVHASSAVSLSQENSSDTRETELPKLTKLPTRRPAHKDARYTQEGEPTELPKPGAQSAIDAAHGGWSVDDWREIYEERLAVAMIDGEQPEQEARRIAHETCVVRWLDLHPLISTADRCAGCGRADRVGNIVPFGADPPGHAWLHPRCWADWHASRRAKAITALAGFGVMRGEES